MLLSAFMSGSWSERRKELACACMAQTERDGESNICQHHQRARRSAQMQAWVQVSLLNQNAESEC